MSNPPQWVRDLKPIGPQGSDILTEERNKSNVNTDQLSTFLFTRDGLARKHRILKILQNEKVFDKSQNYFAGRIDRFETALARSKKLRKLQVQNGWTQEDKMVANELISEPGPYGEYSEETSCRMSATDGPLDGCSGSSQDPLERRFRKCCRLSSPNFWQVSTKACS